MRMIIPFLLIAGTTFAGEPQVSRDLPYVEPKNERQTLDVYVPAEGKRQPVVLWIHGGGRNQGQKAGVQKKPAAFTEKGFLFVSMNYRFIPQVSMQGMAGDVAKAIRWVHDHAHEYGGDPNTIFVMGHSGGAHLAALVCTDNRYLEAERLSLSNIKGCVTVDAGFFDVPKLIRDSGAPASESTKQYFGSTEAAQNEVSPVTYLAKNKSIPPILILHVANRPNTKSQAEWFAAKLTAAGVAVKVVPVEGKDHAAINSDLGLPGDKPTQAIWEFLDGIRNEK